MNPWVILSNTAFWFQGVPFQGTSPGRPDPAVAQRLCGLYRELKADVICLQEVQSEEAFREISNNLGMPGLYCPGKALPQYGGAFFWNSKRCDCRLVSGPGAGAQRMWQIFMMNAAGANPSPGAGLTVCNTHLPSSRQIGAENAARQKLFEMQEILRSVESGPDIILGDFNEHWPGKDLYPYMQNRGYFDSALLETGQAAPSSIRGRRGDYIWIHGRIRDRFLDYGVMDNKDFAGGDTGKEYLSDHLPLWIRVRSEA